MTPAQFEGLQAVLRNHDIAGKASPVVMVDANALRALIAAFLEVAPAVFEPEPDEDDRRNDPWWLDK